jgi:aminopeptidase N
MLHPNPWTIYYRTSPDAARRAVAGSLADCGKKYPFLFTQSQAILARTWVPCQDSPGIRFTYDATVKVPKELLALMSAENPQQKNAEGIYHFHMPQPIPSYLLALSVGDLEFKSFDARTGVYAEPATISKAAYEFADLPKWLKRRKNYTAHTNGVDMTFLSSLPAFPLAAWKIHA